jgi:hypothetical protein
LLSLAIKNAGQVLGQRRRSANRTGENFSNFCWRQKAFGSTADARRFGIAFVPEGRRAMLFLQEPV